MDLSPAMTTLEDPPRPATSQRPRAEFDAPRAGADFPHRPALDGFRGTALVCVMLFHGGVTWMIGGGLAVDAFFVLSGFLITGLLISERARKHRINFGQFWSRRARRLLPALAFALIGIVGYTVLFATPTQIVRLRGDMLATVGYVANWRAVASGEGYLDQFVTPSPLMHMWSLAIEEQFYLLWPVLASGLLAWGAGTRTWIRRLRLAGTICAAAAVGSALWMWSQYRAGNIGRLYYGTDTRAAALLLGAAAAFLNASHGPIRSLAGRRGLNLAAWSFVALGLYAWSQVGHETAGLYRGGFLLASLGATTVIFAGAQPGPSLLKSVLALPPLRFLGKVSYGTYLWHWPLYLVLTPGRIGLTGFPLVAVRLSAAILAGWLSFKLVEWPVRSGRVPTRWFAASIPAAAVIAVVGIFLATSSAPALVKIPKDNAELAAGLEAPPPPPPQPSEAAPELPALRLFIAGDSALFTLGAGFDEERDQRGFDTYGRPLIGCGLQLDGEVNFGGQVDPPTETCFDWPRLWSSDVESYQPTTVFLMASLWDLQDRLINGAWQQFMDGDLDDDYLAALDRAVTTLGHTGAQVFLGTLQYLNREEPALRPGGTWVENDPARVDRLNDLVRRYAGEHPAVTLVDVNRHFWPDGRFTNSIQGVEPILGDGVHFSVAGADLVAHWVIDEIERGRAAAASSTHA